MIPVVILIRVITWPTNQFSSGAQLIADNFTLSEGYDPDNNVLVLNWWGALNTPVDGIGNRFLDFNIYLYEATAPGSGTPQTTASAAWSLNDVFGSSSISQPPSGYGLTAFQYNAVLEGGGLELQAGREYWISIVDWDGNTAPGGINERWQWAASNTASNEDGYWIRNSLALNSNWGFKASQFPGSPPVASNGRAFRLEVANVPEPGSLLFMALTVCFGLGHRYRNRHIQTQFFKLDPPLD